MTFTETIVDRLATSWRTRQTGRRSFLSATAVVGSALATNPLRYAMQPMTATESVCGSGAGCDEGWSAFCCTINGANQCPEGSFVGGWWKADQSGFCCGSARYYVDCNAACGSDWKCHCASGSCDQRRIACNQFRYGQCNQQIKCYGPVVCRVITCTPPWQFDASCTSTSMTDNRTADHSAPCLPGNCPSAITRYYYDHGGPGGKYGPETSPERASAAGGTVLSTKNAFFYRLSDGVVRVLINPGLATYRSTAGKLGDISGAPVVAGGVTTIPCQHGALLEQGAAAFAVSGAFYTKWKAAGGLAVPGMPTQNQAPYGHGQLQHFHAAMIFQQAGGQPYLIDGQYYTAYHAVGLEHGPLGVPVSDTPVSLSATRRYIAFEHGRIYWRSDRGAIPTYGAVFNRWMALGGSTKLGFPVAAPVTYADGAVSQQFDDAVVFVGIPGIGNQELKSVFGARWASSTALLLAGVGWPTGTQIASTAHAARVNCQHGAMIFTQNIGVKAVWGPIYTTYQSLGAEKGALGSPTSDVHASGTMQRCDFQHGSLIYNPATKKVTRV